MKVITNEKNEVQYLIQHSWKYKGNNLTEAIIFENKDTDGNIKYKLDESTVPFHSDRKPIYEKFLKEKFNIEYNCNWDYLFYIYQTPNYLFIDVGKATGQGRTYQLDFIKINNEFNDLDIKHLVNNVYRSYYPKWLLKKILSNHYPELLNKKDENFISTLIKLNLKELIIFTITKNINNNFKNKYLCNIHKTINRIGMSIDDKNLSSVISYITLNYTFLKIEKEIQKNEQNNQTTIFFDGF